MESDHAYTANDGSHWGIMTPFDDGRCLERLNQLFNTILPYNVFHAARLGNALQINSLDQFLSLPVLTKQELVADVTRHLPFGTNLTYPLKQYTRYHHTSGTTGVPLRILDTEDSWDWWGRCWLKVFEAAHVTADDVLFFAFSFAPSIGFWSSYRAAEMLGALLVPGGGTSTLQRLNMMREVKATVLLCTPSYALHLAEVARQNDFPLRDLAIHVLIHAGEPGASIPHTRQQIQNAFDATVIDHAGATEVGAWGIGTADGRGIYVNEDEFIAEVLDRDTQQPVQSGELGELVLTTLGRFAWPVIRYRTGDVVRAVRETADDGSSRLLLQGGVLGRADDMVTIRGVNVFPSAIENLVRQAAGLSEYRATVRRVEQMDELTIELEAEATLCDQVAQLIREQIGIRVAVTRVGTNSLPRWEAKSKRFIDARDTPRAEP